ncbi:DUF3617 family protein [Chitinimonas sp. BJYL2]|uniref:DUF3617 domain-containing protein n=1 Tax=Chitinimonas sp. BJYL2 TaxID=2976696 RepID=UPI0022B4D53D|nr:DUF3617 family protein [Chitinimonas sp. BJYL2]
MRYCLATLACLLAGTLQAAPQATPGQWEMTSKVSMSGMKMAIPPNTVKFCIKPNEVKDLTKQAMGGPQGAPSKDCKMLENSVSGATVKFRMRCEGPHQSDIAGEVSYAGNSYKGKTVIDTTAGPQGKMRMTNEFSAKRIGDC